MQKCGFEMRNSNLHAMLQCQCRGGWLPTDRCCIAVRFDFPLRCSSEWLEQIYKEENAKYKEGKALTIIKLAESLSVQNGCSLNLS